MEAREPKLGAAVGKKGVGKTFTTNKTILSYVLGNPALGIKGRRVLVLDVNDEYEDLKAILVKDVRVFSAQTLIEARRIRPFNEDGTKWTINDILANLSTILAQYRNGMLLLEDINRYVSDSLPNDVIGAICTNRHTDTDIIMHFQSIGRITPKIWQNLNYLRFHKNTDSVFQHRSKYIDKERLLTLAEIIVNSQYKANNKRYYCYVEVEEEKIRGNISPEMIDHAIEEYISKNYKKIITPMLSQQTASGTKKFNAATAYRYVAEEIKSELF